ncbi:anhydro-N-acetylmuramic acid kinase [Paenibacillus azoreducens]|uniref:Anhydro-N-acetylmuramic acid kinase n=1 Tax=Paenibacillus azoreducens TaxID=116718 RepID=A0A919YBM4_9BACL|nr:anhydro-N-acetylmuramic acid kinase [Paenibacillus azoreducens]GIO46173.1 anhydro-N-acetylmuramic acid kinase [Paenibacillus azoreducens]
MKRETLDKHSSRYAVGLMSGTSVDGIDAAVIELADRQEGSISVQMIAFENVPYPAAVRQEIFALFDPVQATVDRLGRLNVLLGELYADAALSVIAKAGLTPADITVIGSHGQTIYHAPQMEKLHGYDIHYTVQIGEGSVIRARTGIPCVTDFRPADMAAGGQGAPLVPFTEFLLYREEKRTLLLQNIGGIGNMTVIPAGCAQEEVFAFDTGPGNMIIDGVVERLFSGQLTMDIGGAIARRGRIHEGLLGLLKLEPYYSQPLPKSTGREQFGSSYIDWLLNEAGKQNVTPEDVVATVTMLTAWSIGDAYCRYVHGRYPADALIVGGGGSYNPVLVENLRREMEMLGVQVMTQEQIGQSSDAKEAVAFAILADYALRRQPNNLPNVTGAKRPVVMGKISF